MKNSTYTNLPATKPTEFNIDSIKEAIAELEKFECPINKFAKEKGFDLDNGDAMFVPRGFAEAYNFPERKGVYFSNGLDCGIVLTKKDLLRY